ncbi:MAG: hypothetical protein WEF86_01120 [Gemmatimonadota bacterium]
MRYPFLLFAAAAIAACDGDPVAPMECETVSLPLSQSADGPVVTHVGLEVEEFGVVLVATATDPQGGDNLRDVVQRIGVYPDPACDGTPITLSDDLVDAGVEETFGTVASAQQELYDDIAVRTQWPVHVEFRDADGNITSGRVLAQVTVLVFRAQQP